MRYPVLAVDKADRSPGTVTTARGPRPAWMLLGPSARPGEVMGRIVDWLIWVVCWAILLGFLYVSATACAHLVTHFSDNFDAGLRRGQSAPGGSPPLVLPCRDAHRLGPGESQAHCSVPPRPGLPAAA